MGRILDAIVSLFATTEKSNRGLLRTFALKILDSIETTSEDDPQASNGKMWFMLVHQRVQAAEKKKTLTPELGAQHRLPLMRISMAIAHLLDTALQEKAAPNIVSTLEALASKLPRVDGGKLD